MLDNVGVILSYRSHAGKVSDRWEKELILPRHMPFVVLACRVVRAHGPHKKRVLIKDMNHSSEQSYPSLRFKIQSDMKGASDSTFFSSRAIV